MRIPMICAVALLAGGVGMAEEANRLSAAERAEGWRLLWDGTSFDGWVRADGKTPAGEGWEIKDGVLSIQPRRTWAGDGQWKWNPIPGARAKGGMDICTRECFRDFHLKVDFRLPRAANSGIKYFYNPDRNAGTTTEYQLLDPAHPAPPNAPAESFDNKRLAGLYYFYPAPAAASLLKPCGEWNTAEIISKGRHVEHWLNGVKVLSYERGGTAFREAFKLTKWNKPKFLEGGAWGEAPEGRILLQDHDDAVAFRNIKIRTLFGMPAKIIFDTDMYTDFDDVGALATLHAFADAGECEILGTVASTRGTPALGMVEIINAYYGRPDIPVGANRELGIGPLGWKHAIYDIYSDMVKANKDVVKHPTSDAAPDANETYRKILAAQPDGSVTICSVGFTTNLRRLLETTGDAFSPLDGRALVAKKVKAWYAMACRYPDGYEYNSKEDGESSRIAFRDWPTPIYFLDWCYGVEVKCGVPVSKRRMPVNPVRDVFKRALTAYKETEKGHPAWDEVTVLAAVRGWERYFGTVRGRFDIVDAKGKNAWTADPNGNHYVLTVKTPKAEVGAIVDELMARGSIPSVRSASALTEARTYTSADGATLGYRFHAPAKIEPGRRYPLVLFLHGAGERGDDNALQQVHGVWPLLSYMKEKGIDGYLIAPQCPKGQQWVDTPWNAASHRMSKTPSASMALVLELLDKTFKECPVDKSRVYVTGLSMGGYGTWDIVQRCPDLFAAAMPLCGGGDPALARTIREVPIWAFHGDCDKAVPVRRSRQMVAALWQCDGNVRYREYPGVGHNCWDATYSDASVLDWLFSSRRTPSNQAVPVELKTRSQR